MDPLKIAFFTHQEPNSPLEHLRVVGPISHTDIKIQFGTVLKQNIYDYIAEADLIVIQRVFPADFYMFNQIFKISRELRKPIVYDFDDNLFILPENHPDRKTFGISKALMPMLFAAFKADHITVSNEYLKNKFLELNENVHILENYLDDSIWSLTPPKKHNDKESITIAYMGGDSHKSDLEMITPVLIDIKAKYSERVRFHFYGIKPPESILNFPDTIWTPIKTYHYAQFAQDFQKIAVDFFIAPLTDNEFNRCKSSIKFLEYSAVGSPGVYSRVVPYTEIITNQKNGLLANSPEDWNRHIELLINNPEFRYQLALSAQNLVKENYLMSNNAHKWKKTYQNIIKLGITKQNTNSKLKNIIEAIAPQLQDFQSNNEKNLMQCHSKLNIAENKIKDRDQVIGNLNDQVSSLNNQVSSLNNQINALKEEVLFYALSKSWRLTRPIRKINRKIKGRNID